MALPFLSKSECSTPLLYNIQGEIVHYPWPENKAWFMGQVNPQTGDFVAIACETDNEQVLWIFPWDKKKYPKTVPFPDSKTVSIKPYVHHGRLIFGYDRGYSRKYETNFLLTEDNRLEKIDFDQFIYTHEKDQHFIINALTKEKKITLPIGEDALRLSPHFPTPSWEHRVGYIGAFHDHVIECEREKTLLIHAINGHYWEINEKDEKQRIRPWSLKSIHSLYYF